MTRQDRLCNTRMVRYSLVPRQMYQQKQNNHVHGLSKGYRDAYLRLPPRMRTSVRIAVIVANTDK